MKFLVCIGGLNYSIDSLTDEFFIRHAEPFTSTESKDSYEIKVTNQILENFNYFNKDLDAYTNETVYILDRVIKHCLDYNRMIIHGAALAYRNNAYLFAAPSGTGKTTHISLWKEYLKDEVTIINGDKPMLEFSDEIVVHGTPWNGKENIGRNTSAPLKGIVVLKQAKENQFRKLNTNEALKNLIVQTFYSLDKKYGPKTTAYLTRIINSIPIYELSCGISKEAFETCYKGLTENEYPN